MHFCALSLFTCHSALVPLVTNTEAVNLLTCGASMQTYDKPEMLWTELASQPDGTQKAWYNKAVAYWDNQEASVNGVLGGYGHVSDDDIVESRKFLLKVVWWKADATQQSLLNITTDVLPTGFWSRWNRQKSSRCVCWQASHLLHTVDACTCYLLMRHSFPACRLRRWCW